MTGSEPLDPIRQLYEDSLEKHGTVPAGVGWPDPDAHRLRFDKLAELIEASGDLTINDLGCGYGAFFGYLRERGVAIETFRGYDISGPMIERAREQEPEGDFRLGARLDEPADYSFACGIFNVRLERVEEDWHRHILATLDNMAEHSTRGFAFNLLTTYVDFRRDHLYYGDPSAFFELCKTRYSKHVSLLHDYPLFEWTMLVRL